MLLPYLMGQTETYSIQDYVPRCNLNTPLSLAPQAIFHSS